MTVPARREVEATVVANPVHRFTYGATCMDCGQDSREARCEPTTYSVWPTLTVPGEVV